MNYRNEIYLVAFIFIFLFERWISRKTFSSKEVERWIVNGTFSVLNVLCPTAKILFAITFRPKPIFSLASAQLPGPVEFIISFVMISCFAWITHFLMHKVPLFWRIHRLHHSDELVDSTTTARFHPLETLITFFMIFFPTVVLFGVRAEFFIAYVFIDALSNLMIHSHIKLPASKIIDLIWATPEAHRLHHSSIPAHFNRNFGTTLNIWDRLFQTKAEGVTDDYGIEQAPVSSIRNIGKFLFLRF